jgi:Xaa-Pro dipeptidase
MHYEQRQRTTELLKSRGVERALFASLDSVKWLTGFAPMIELGHPHPFSGGPALVWYENGDFILIVLDAYAAQTAPLNEDPDIRVVRYAGYTIERNMTPGANLAETLGEIVRNSGAGRVGIEAQHLTALQLHALTENTQADVMYIDTWLLPLRRIKTAEELVKLRYNFRLTDLGHAVARQETQAGKTEIEVWSAVHAAVQREAGGRVPLGNDCVVGYRQENIGGAPEHYTLRPGDTLTVDLSTVWQGYWSDSCMTYYAGERSAKQAKIHQHVREALEYGISLIRPGVVAREVDQKVRAFIEKAGYGVYPHHTGHSVGVAPHEAPRIVPYNDETLEEGMVIMLEPGIYLPGELSVRLEDAMLVTADGVEVLTKHRKD